MTMDKLPEIRIVVKPYPGLYKKWQWEVQQHRQVKSHKYWSCVLSAGFNLLEGKSRTEEKALDKARRTAADYCDYLLRVKEREKHIKGGTIIEKVTCKEEPV